MHNSMHISSVVVHRPFLSEVEWAKKTINEIKSYKTKSWAIGLNGDTGKPDGFTTSFAARHMNCVTYIRAAGLSIGTPEAYDHNITLLTTYIERERQQEISSVNGVIARIKDYESRSWAIGLGWPNGQPDEFTRYFAFRSLPIEYYLRGSISVGEPTAYDKNIGTLKNYLDKVGNAML